MNDAPLHLPEYGDSGDLIGARRMRRAFRWGVALAVFFTVLMWVTESFWRYSPAEQKYRSALTLLPNQGRNLLRQSVKYDAEAVTQSSKYYEALAEREEDDLVISAYENASKLDPQNADLAIKFGCQLYKSQLFARAREQFRLAAEGGTHNALAVYLEAAVLPTLTPDDFDAEVALSLVKQANSTGDPVAFPRPMWFPDLPRQGHWFALLRRQMTQFCSAPLEKFAEFVLEASEKELAAGRTANSIANLQVMETMGRRIAMGAIDQTTTETELAGGSLQLYLGIRVMSLAVEQQKRVMTVTSGAPDESAVSLAAKLEPALRTIDEFERSRQSVIDAERNKYRFPWTLLELAMAVTFACFAIAYGIGKVLRVQGPAHSVSHSTFARTTWIVCFLVEVGMLLLVSALQRSSHGDLPAQGMITVVWYLVLLAGILVGVVTPAVHVPSPESMLKRIPPEQRHDLTAVRKRYRAVYASLVKRYLGVQFGLTLCAACIWIIAYRVFVGTYPWMMPLLVTGTESEEIAMIRAVLATLG
ncbi:MAG: hypothetical protein HUU46_17195 [Candidatus Hydrogenedentes bacterium]|nr:hypothetical protein [Candidatus Hydrogenedentota bacterium]